MDADNLDINADFKGENIEILSSTKINVDDETDGEDDVVDDFPKALPVDDPLVTNDDELETDKMDYEAEEKDYI